MSRLLELSDDLYAALQDAAQASGTTPVGWMAAHLGVSPQAQWAANSRNENGTVIGYEASSHVETYLEGLIRHLLMPKSWIDEGVQGPTKDCKDYSLQVMRRLFDAFGMIPYKITASKEGGIFAAYKNPRNRNILRLEVDNDLDVVAVVSDGETILDSGLLEADDLERSFIRSFDPQLA